MVEPIEEINGVSSASKAKAAHAMHIAGVTPSDGNNTFASQVNYIYLVMKFTDVAMKHQAEVVQLQSQLADVVTKIQSDLSTVSEFLSKLQAESHSQGEMTGQWASETHSGDAQYFDLPDTYNGLSSDFYDVYQQTSGGDGAEYWGTDQSSVGGFQTTNAQGNPLVSAQYQSEMSNFMTAIKQLFYASPATPGSLTVSDISHIDNPFGGKSFDLGCSSGGLLANSYWGGLQKSFGKYDVTDSDHVISTDSTKCPSLIQQYMYYQAQIKVATGTAADVNSANGDISKIVDFDPNSENKDPTLTPMLQVLDSLNTTVNVNPIHTMMTKQTTGNILKMILQGQLYTQGTANGQGIDVGGSYHKFEFAEQAVTPGLYMAFAYMAYNYVWSKNPNADTSQVDAYATPGNHGWMTSGNWDYKASNAGHAAGDPLSEVYGSINSAQSNFSQAGSSTNTQFQLNVNQVQQIQNTAQKITEGYGTAQMATIQNFKG